MKSRYPPTIRDGQRPNGAFYNPRTKIWETNTNMSDRDRRIFLAKNPGFELRSYSEYMELLNRKARLRLPPGDPERWSEMWLPNGFRRRAIRPDSPRPSDVGSVSSSSSADRLALRALLSMVRETPPSPRAPSSPPRERDQPGLNAPISIPPSQPHSGHIPSTPPSTNPTRNFHNNGYSSPSLRSGFHHQSNSLRNRSPSMQENVVDNRARQGLETANGSESTDSRYIAEHPEEG